jgi:hypothetical protein
MPGTYKVKLWADDFVRTPLATNVQESIECLEKYCLAWSWKAMDCTDPDFDLSYPVINWQRTEPGAEYEKRWEYEPCDAFSEDNLGTYVQPIDRVDPGSQLSWQWYNYMCDIDSGHTWQNAKFQNSRAVVWDDLAGPCIDTNGWNDRQVLWKWNSLFCESSSPFNTSVTWNELKCSVNTGQSWDQLSEACTAGITSTVIQTIRREAPTTFTVHVKEIMPVAFLSIEQEPSPKKTPHTVRLSARFTKCGSFPIEKIVWDLGDGTPLLEQKRWDIDNSSHFAYNDIYNLDYEDPRNFDVVHTYTRKSSSDFTFYPSITAYASNTHSSDCCSAVIGPIRGVDVADTADSTALVQNYVSDDKDVGIVLKIKDSVVLMKS